MNLRIVASSISRKDGKLAMGTIETQLLQEEKETDEKFTELASQINTEGKADGNAEQSKTQDKKKVSRVE